MDGQMIGVGLLLMLVGLAWWILTTTLAVDGSPCDRRGWIGLGMIALGLMLCVIDVYATPRITPTPTKVQAVQVPEASTMYRRWVEQAVAEEWGVDGSPARLAAQIHQESGWDPHARSEVGAEGLAHFMPATGKWIAATFPDKLGEFDAWDPQQAALAAAVYDAWLVRRNPGRDACASWAFGLSAYNGGELHLHQEQQLAARHGRARDAWFGNVALQRSRGLGAWQQNRDYVRRILIVLEPAYIDAGWSGKAVCT